jgi:kynureninase
MVYDFAGAPDAGAWQIGTTHLFSTAPLLGSLAMTSYMIHLLDALYTSFEDVWKTLQILREFVENKVYEQFAKEREVVA